MEFSWKILQIISIAIHQLLAFLCIFANEVLKNRFLKLKNEATDAHMRGIMWLALLNYSASQLKSKVNLPVFARYVQKRFWNSSVVKQCKVIQELSRFQEDCVVRLICSRRNISQGDAK